MCTVARFWMSPGRGFWRLGGGSRFRASVAFRPSAILACGLNAQGRALVGFGLGGVVGPPMRQNKSLGRGDWPGRGGWARGRVLDGHA
jgi:hypothetical protein